MKFNVVISGLIMLLVLVACKKEAPAPILAESNRWVLDSMRVYYYWNEQLPAHPADQSSTSVFFNKLLNSADRFSFMIDPSETRTEYSSFAWYGFDYAILEKSGKMLGIVTLVPKGSPADRAGIKRGDCFASVNDVPLNTSTIGEAERLLRLGTGIRLGMGAISANGWEPATTIQINTSRFVEQPVYVTKTLEGNGKKAAYIFYNQFAGSYDYRILDAIASFKGQGINDLILDLRYNLGGDVSSAAKIAASLSNCKADDVFVIYQANKNGGRRTSSFQQTMNETGYGPQNFGELVQYRVGFKRVIMLTTAATASASELLANALKPYMEVILIGDRTMGKDMSSFAIEDQQTPKKINLVLHPLVFKLYNAKGQGDYSEGLQPDYWVDEFSVLPLRPFGNIEDPLIKKALDLIGISSARAMNMHKSFPALKHNLVQHTGRSPLPMITKTVKW